MKDNVGEKVGDKVMDIALSMLEETGPEYCGGLVNHGPMAADAMIALGRPEAVLPWIDYYRRRLQPPAGHKEVIAATWAESLGNRCFGGWFAFFERVISEEGWPAALRKWLPRLSAGFAAAGTHGVLRTAHAVRSLARRETPRRIRELAAGLAYWASHYQSLSLRICGRKSGGNGRNGNALRPWQAMRRMRRLPKRLRRRYGLPEDRLARLNGFPRFAETIERLDTSPEPERLLSELTEAFARAYLAAAGDIRTATDLSHTVTATASVRWLLPFLDRSAAQRLLRHAWQTGAAFYCALGANPVPPASSGDSPAGWDELVETALDSGDEHAIKFTEACLREYGLTPKPVYLEAARKGIEEITAMAALTNE